MGHDGKALAGLVLGGTFRADGVPVGAWLLDLVDLPGTASVAEGQCVLLVAGRDRGRPYAELSVGSRDDVVVPTTMPARDPAARPFTLAGFLSRVVRMRVLVHASRHGRLDPRAERRLLRIAGLLEVDPAALRAAVLDQSDAAYARVVPFMRTLDAQAAGLWARVGLREPSDEDYAAMDETFDPRAPLKRVLMRHPMLAQTANEARERDRETFDAMDDAAVDAVLRQDVGKLCGPGPSADVDALEGILRPLGWDAQRTMRKSCKGDAVLAMARVLPHLPPSWTPGGDDEWVAFATCLPALEFAMVATRPGHLAQVVPSKGRWRETADRLHGVYGRVGRPMLLMRPVRDMGWAFADQVVRPLLGEGKIAEADVRAMSTLFGGLGALRMLETSRAWHQARARMEVRLPGLPADERGWDALLPDATYGEVRVVVLRARPDLVAEGRSGRDANGMAGLDHCVGGYSRPCREGRIRVVSLRRRDGDAWARLSTAEITNGKGIVLEQHRGPRNAAPPPEAMEALKAYLADLRSGALAHAWGPVARPSPTADPRPWRERALDDAGYDFEAPGALDLAVDLWRPFLPARSRGATRESLTRDLTRLTGTGTWWEPPARGRRLNTDQSMVQSRA